MTINIRTDCRYFKGDIPCAPHKKSGVHCETCEYYDPVSSRILIIKLGAIGDVVRTTPLLRKLWNVYPRSEIWWLTHTPEIVPRDVDYILPFNASSILILQATPFDIAYNLDKDRQACAPVNLIHAKVKKGFYLKDGKTAPLNNAAQHKFMTGVFDDTSKANKKSYQQEIFEICGFTFASEEYVLDNVEKNYHWDINRSRKVIGLNTGCGRRWRSRLWKSQYWVELARLLRKRGYEIVLLGGEQEHEQNKKFAEMSSALYFGYFPLKRFINLMDQCDLVVTAVTMAMHLAIGLKKKLILFNNIFNPHEFELYGRGEIIQPEMQCNCYFQTQCTNHVHCMDTIKPEKVLSVCEKWLKKD